MKKKSADTPCEFAEEVRGLNKMITTVLAFGAGMAAFNYVQKNNMMSGRQMKKMQKRMTRAFF
ncbi:MAG: YrzQ family protein [Bacillota bacterium]|nr:YrzQ family protein [Bacillota bacterium]